MNLAKLLNAIRTARPALPIRARKGAGSIDSGKFDFDVATSQKLADLLKQAIGMQDFSRIVHICHYLLQTEHLGGAVVEFGCHQGRTAKLLSALTERTVYVYDSFEGMPADEGFLGGELSASVDALHCLFDLDGARRPIVRAGWFNELSPADVPDRISFAHLDGDLYESTLTSLQLVYPKLLPGATMLIDDYLNPRWRGVERALLEFLAERPETVKALPGIKGGSSFKGLIVKE